MDNLVNEEEGEEVEKSVIMSKKMERAASIAESS